MALVVREELHPRFERKGNDLLTRLELPLLQALTCTYVEVPLLDGDYMEVCCLTALRDLLPCWLKVWQAVAHAFSLLLVQISMLECIKHGAM